MIFKHVADKFASRKSEWFLASITAGLGVIYVARPVLFVERDWYTSMREMMPQQYWALLCLAIGITRLSFLVINGAFHASPAIRCMAGCANVFLWVALIVAAFLNDHGAQSMVIFPAMLTLELVVIYETAVDWAAASRTTGQGARTYAGPG